MNTPISGHTSPETAYTVEGYPYGFRLRTTMRYWVETKRGHGQRVMSQTLNPKTNKWNKPKASTYAPITILALDEQTHVVNESLGSYDSIEDIEMFALWAQHHLTEWQVGALDYLRAGKRAEKHLTWSIHICQPGCTEHHQTLEEQNRMMNQAIAHEMRQGS